MNTRVIVLAAGKGKRMKSELPKVLTLLRGRPMITYLLDAIARSGVDSRPTLVIGTGADLVEQQLGGGYDYVLQEELLGTGHAVSCAMKEMKDSGDAIIVLYGDHPFVKAETIQKLKATHEAQQPALTMVTVLLDDFEGWRAPFYDFGRIERNQRGEIVGIIEKKDAEPEQLELREVNPSFFCFDSAWLKQHLSELTRDNAQQEYYLTDLVRIAMQEGASIASLDVSPLETIGINTPEHLALAHILESTQNKRARGSATPG